MTEQRPSTKKEAREKGSKFYYTGNPCKRGHYSVRYTSSSLCVECQHGHNLNEDPEKRRERVREWQNENREQARAASQNWKKNNQDKLREYRVNRRPVAAESAKRKAKKLQATPPWVDNELIQLIYEECPEGFHVDHIVPLQNDRVCGLHCPDNFQYLTAEQNLSKGNRFD